jgi:hypothetical protein
LDWPNVVPNEKEKPLAAAGVEGVLDADVIGDDNDDSDDDAPNTKGGEEDDDDEVGPNEKVGIAGVDELASSPARAAKTNGVVVDVCGTDCCIRVWPKTKAGLDADTVADEPEEVEASVAPPLLGEACSSLFIFTSPCCAMLKPVYTYGSLRVGPSFPDSVFEREKPC